MHVSLDESGNVVLDARGGLLDYEQSGRLLRFYEDGLNGYTYVEDRHGR